MCSVKCVEKIQLPFMLGRNRLDEAIERGRPVAVAALRPRFETDAPARRPLQSQSFRLVISTSVRGSRLHPDQQLHLGMPVFPVWMFEILAGPAHVWLWVCAKLCGGTVIHGPGDPDDLCDPDD